MDKRAYGRWQSGNFPDQHPDTLYHFRIRFEVFGQRRGRPQKNVQRAEHFPKATASNYRALARVPEEDRAAEALGVGLSTVSRWLGVITNSQVEVGYTRIGELSKQLEKAAGRPAKNSSQPREELSKAATLKEAGISTSQAHRSEAA